MDDPTGMIAMPRAGKGKSKEKVKKVMGEYARGTLRSGSKTGPKVTNPAQAKAIAMSESGQSRRGKKD